MDATAATSSSSSAAVAVTPRTVKAKAGGGKHSTLQQKSIGAFFAGGTRTTYATLPGIGRQIRSVTSLTPEQLQAVGKAPEKFTSCAKGCGQTFLHGPARVAHEKFCSGRAAETAAEVAAAAEAAASAATTTQPATAVTEAAAEAADSSDDEQPPAKAPKLRADGGIKQSGLRQGEKKGMKHSLYFKLEVVRTLRRLQSLEKRWEKAPSGWRGAGIETSEIHKGVHPSLVSKWGGKEDELHMALQHENRVSRKQKHRTGTMATFQSRGARRTTLHRGRAPPFAAVEVELHKRYRDKRTRGERVTGQWLRVSMKRLVREFAGADVADGFKASKWWLRSFARRFGMSLRRKSNSRAESVLVRLPKIKRWHARLRRRLRGGPQEKLDPKWGRWLPRNRLSVDQVPCNLRAGDGRTYDDTGAKRVWLAGAKADDGKRFCTLQIVARASNGDASMPRHGQPKLCVIFRGQGKQISQNERDARHSDVQVRFQPKAWADDQLCEDFADVEMREATAAARAAGERSVAIFDNLSTARRRPSTCATCSAAPTATATCCRLARRAS